MKIRILTPLLFLLAFVQAVVAQELPIQTGKDVAVANTESGKVRGYIHNGIFTYKGIPYATAERFMPPEKPKPWDGVRSSTTWGPVAPLMKPTTHVTDEPEFVFDHDWGYTSEDCLVLNVWTPSITDGKKRPVMFWIHGGGYTAGSSQELPSYYGENLSRKGDVVVVSINHRLNVLGFLDLSAYGEKYRHSANNSMLDLVAALQWVKANISNFGGDPGNVMIFGQSGGGAKVNTLMAMPKAKGLFHKAVNESGAIRGAILEQEDTRSIAAETLMQLHLSPSQVDSLQTIPFQVLADASSKAMKVIEERMKKAGKPIMGFGLGWGPSRDGNDLPYQLNSEEAYQLSKNIPLMIGTVKNEFAPFANMKYDGASEQDILAHINEQYKEKADVYIAAVKKAYPKDTDPKDLIDVDTRFRPGAVAQANEKSALEGGAPVYMYLFTWQSPVFNGKYKALHCMELPFVFNNIDRCQHMTGGGEEAKILADKMSQAWINFARNGNPNHAGLPNWPAYTAANTATMHFDTKCDVLPQLDKELFEIVKENQN